MVVNATSIDSRRRTLRLVHVFLLLLIVIFFSFPLSCPTFSTVINTKSTLDEKTADSGEDNAAVDTSIRHYVVPRCEEVTDVERKGIAKEIADYEASSKFRSKILEVKGEKGVAPLHRGIDLFLREHALQPGWNILELGCGAGMMIKLVHDAYQHEASNLGEVGELVGVELVPGWVNFAKAYFNDIHIYEADITSFSLPPPHDETKFHLVMLNDVMEHIQKSRYSCLLSKLDEVTVGGSLVYMHTPTPWAQLSENSQSYENVLPHHFLVSGMAQFGFELVLFQHDVELDCGSDLLDGRVPRTLKKARCNSNGWPKYYHVLFMKVENRQVFHLT